jgi:hypothetical protein
MAPYVFPGMRPDQDHRSWSPCPGPPRRKRTTTRGDTGCPWRDWVGEPKRTVGRLRHAVFEAMKYNPGESDDLRRAITGHKGNGAHEANYGRFLLELKPLQRIVLPFDPASVWNRYSSQYILY